MEVPQNTKNRTTTWPSNSTSGYIFKGNKSLSWRGICTPIVPCNIIHNSQDMETTKASINRWMDKENLIIYKYYSAIKKKEILPLVTNLRALLSEISQIEKKYCMISLMCGIYKHWTQKQSREWWLLDVWVGGRVGKKDESCPSVQSSSY